MKFINDSNLEERLNSIRNTINTAIGTAKSEAIAEAKSYTDTEVAKKANSSHTHNYAGSSSAGGAANSVKTNMTIKLNGGSTEGTNLFTFNGSTAKTVNITASGIGAAASSHTHDDRYFTETEITTKINTINTNISTAKSEAIAAAKSYTDTGLAGKANSSHGTHVTYGGNGSASTVSRSDHTHSYAGSTSAGGAANSANLIEISDTRNTNPAPKDFSQRGVKFDFKSNATIGLANVGKNFAGVMTMQQWSDVDKWTGGKTTQLAFTDDNKIHVRKGEAGTWGSWAQIYTTANKPTPIDIKAQPLLTGPDGTEYMLMLDSNMRLMIVEATSTASVNLLSYGGEYYQINEEADGSVTMESVSSIPEGSSIGTLCAIDETTGVKYSVGVENNTVILNNPDVMIASTSDVGEATYIICSNNPNKKYRFRVANGAITCEGISVNTANIN